MKKNIFYWVFLVVAGMSLTACSSGDDNIADNTTPVTPDSQNKTVILTGTIGVGGDETRAVNNNGVTSWQKNNVIAINYQKNNDSYARAQGTITNVSSDGKYATFEAELTDAKNDGNIGFAYPNDKVTSNTTPNSAYNFEFNYSAYYTGQNGTIGYISDDGLDYACTESGGEVKMAVDGSTAKLKGNALLKNQFCMYKFNLVKEGETSTTVAATKLEIYIASGSTFGSTATYTIEPTAATNELYVVLKPKAVGDKVKIVASFDEKDAAKKLDATAAAEISSTDYGKFIGTDASDGNQAYLYSSSNSAKVCEHTYGTNTKFVKGKFYSSNLTVKDLTPTAVIAYTGPVSNYCEKFIALALSDATDGSTVVTLGEGQSLVNNWLANGSNPRTLKIANTTYPASLSGTQGKYDNVKANPQDASNHFSAANPADVESNESADALYKGWRLPTVTDFRHIFSQLKDAENNIVMNGITATNPKGIMDHNGVYGYYTGTYGDGGQWNYPYKDAYDNPLSNYYRGSSPLLTYINHLLGTYTMGSQYYWLGSGVIEENQSTASTDKGWRYSFNNDYFIWNAAGITDGDKAFIRLVFAY